MNILSIFFQSYSSILLVIGALAGLVFLAGLYVIFKMIFFPQTEAISNRVATTQRKNKLDRAVLPDAANDVTDISGEDPMATQLDLARAYIETGKKQFAKIILAAVIREGNASHQEEAQRLLSSI